MQSATSPNTVTGIWVDRPTYNELMRRLCIHLGADERLAANAVQQIYPQSTEATQAECLSRGLAPTRAQLDQYAAKHCARRGRSFKWFQSDVDHLIEHCVQHYQFSRQSQLAAAAGLSIADICTRACTQLGIAADDIMEDSNAQTESD